jgi:adenylate kinase
MKAIIVTGTPGTGKTTIAKEIAQRLRMRYVDVNRLIRKHRLSLGRDCERDCQIIDPKALNKVLSSLIRSSRQTIVIDSHLSHYLPKRDVSHCIVTRCGLPALRKRLQARRYSERKCRENLDAEIFEVCLQEAIERGHKVLLVETDRRLVWGKIMASLKEELNGKRPAKRRKV